MKRLILLFFPLLFCLAAAHAIAEPLDVSAQHPNPVGKSLTYLQESGDRLSLDQAMAAYAGGRFHASSRAVPRFGITTQPVWLRLQVQNRTGKPAARRLSLERTWLDVVDFYVVREDRLVQHWHTGDNLPFSQRPLKTRYFAFDHAYAPGLTTLYIRAETAEAMVLPLYFSTSEQFYSREMGSAHWYGILYGGLVVLLVYNLVLFFNLRSTRYLFYSAYLLSFLFANLSYTGHAYQYLWPDHPGVQHWANPVLVIVFCLFGLAFATSFLDTRQRFPRLYKAIVATGLLVSLLTVLSVILGAQGLAMKVAMAFLILFSLGMMFLGVLSWRAGVPSAKYFLAASITHTSAISLSVLIVLNALDWGDFGIHITEIAMLVDAVLLAFALADQFRILQNEKFLAEKLANIDHLTGIWNRRGFQQLVSPLWHTGLRNQHHMSVILMDLDQFKRVNDRHGHASGDQVLQQTASMLNSSARAGDVLARWGGEEFILFLPETGLSKATHIAERLRQSLIRMETGLTDLPLTASFGVAHVHARDIGMEELIRYADSYLYRAKEEGRNRVFFGEAGDTANMEAQMAT